MLSGTRKDAFVPTRPGVRAGLLRSDDVWFTGCAARLQAGTGAATGAGAAIGGGATIGTGAAIGAAGTSGISKEKGYEMIVEQKTDLEIMMRGRMIIIMKFKIKDERPQPLEVC